MRARALTITWGLTALLAEPLATSASEEPAPKDSVEHIARLAHDPSGEAVVLPIQFFQRGGAGGGVGERIDRLMELQGIIPVLLGEHKLVFRPTLPFLWGDTESGLGDIVLESFYYPQRKPIFRVGLGAILQFPTAAHPKLGVGAFSAGPALLLRYRPEGWNIAFWLEHLRSVAGRSGRSPIDVTYLQPAVTRHLGNGWGLSASIESWVDWERSRRVRMLLPIGLSGIKVVRLGIPISLSAGVLYNAVRPATMSAWSFRFVVAPIFPVER